MEYSKTKELIELTQRFQEHLYSNFDTIKGDLIDKLALFHLGRENMIFLCKRLIQEENLGLNPEEYWYLKYEDWVPRIQKKCKVILQKSNDLFSLLGLHINYYHKLLSEFIVENDKTMLDFVESTFEDFKKTYKFN